ncbi:MAG: hypothetical protein HY335_03075 [Deinococcus sp.]|nr:hypothetical protein [Deinococcus sp.]
MVKIQSASQAGAHYVTESPSGWRSASNPVSIRSGSRFSSSLQLFAQAAGALAILVGCLVLVGWLLDIAALKGILPGLATMKPNAAIAFLLVGLSLWLLLREQAARWKRNVARGCALLVALLGLLTLSEYLFSWDLGIDQLLFPEAVRADSTSLPGRMASATALNFVVLGLALLFLDVKTRRGHWPAQFLALLGVLIGFLALIGYAYGVQALYAIAFYTSMALHTAATLTVLAVGVLLARPDRGLMTLVTSDGVGGMLVRRRLPVVLGVPLLLGWLRLQGQRAGLYGTELDALH